MLEPYRRDRFNEKDRPTVADVEIHRDGEGHVTHITMAPPLYKTRGSVFAQVPLSFVYTEHPNNACRLLIDMMKENPLRPDEDPKVTPLFRFPRSAGKLAGQVLDPRLLIRIDRDAIDSITASQPEAFRSYSHSSRFSGHSYRIGGAVALLLADAPRHVLMSSGRWYAPLNPTSSETKSRRTGCHN